MKGEIKLVVDGKECSADFDLPSDLPVKEMWNRHISHALAAVLREQGIEKGWKEMWWNA